MEQEFSAVVSSLLIFLLLACGGGAIFLMWDKVQEHPKGGTVQQVSHLSPGFIDLVNCLHW